MKKILSLLILTVLVFCSAFAVSAGNVNHVNGNGNTVIFVDVPESHWAKDQIEYFAEQGLIDGYEDGSFKPNDGVTREEFCKLLVTTFKAPLEKSKTQSFADVSTDRWSFPYIEICRDFMTGYANPFGGLPSFHPTEYATREDIAVALVRMMGYTDDDANDKNYATRKFVDGNTISPNLVPYVSVACEKGLINGYPSGKFSPSKGITRAEAVVLLNRATKQAVTNIDADLELSATTKYSSNKKTVTIYIVAESGTAVTVDGETVKMSNNYDGATEGTYVYEFKKIGSKRFTVEGKKSGKTKTLTVYAEYKVEGPTLKVTECPQSSTESSVRISGTVESSNGNISLTVNDKSVYVSYTGSWYTDVKLENGDNDIIIIATDSGGGETKIKKVIEFEAKAPKIEFSTCPDYSVTKDVKFSGYVYDDYGIESFKVNGESYRGLDSKGSTRLRWEISYELKEGKNEIEFVATSTSGAKTKVTKEVTLNENAPELSVDKIPEVTDEDTIKISGSVSNDADSGWMLRINNELVKVKNYYWSHNLILEPGVNNIVIEAINDLGKSTTVKKTIKFNPPAPVLKITEWPTSTTSSSATVIGTVEDDNTDAKNIKLTVNGKSVWVSSGYYYYYDDEGEWETTVSLTPGKNKIVVVAENEYGVKTTKTIEIDCGLSKPALKVTGWPKTTEENSVIITGEVSDSEDRNPVVTVNGTKAKVASDGTWEATVMLEEGTNKITVKATNMYGFSESKDVTVELIIPEEEPVEEEDSVETPVEKDSEEDGEASTEEDGEASTEEDINE